MTIREEKRDHILVLRLSGDVLGGPEAQEVNDRLREGLRQGYKRAVLDVAEVRLVNSSGLGLLIAGLTIMRNAGGELALAGVSSKLAKLLEVTKLSQVFAVYHEVEEAIAAFQLA